MLKIEVSYPVDHLAIIALNNMTTKNALDMNFWFTFREIIKTESSRQNTKVILVTGKNNAFFSGLNVVEFYNFSRNNITKAGMSIDESIRKLSETIKIMQDSLSILESCSAITIACIDGICIGAGIELALACDIVYCTRNSEFCIKETAFGFAADLGLFQRGAIRLMKNPSLFKELAFSSAWFDADTAEKIGLVGKICPDYEAMTSYAKSLQVELTSKAAIRDIKDFIGYSMNNGSWKGLEYARLLNSGILLGNPLLSSKEAKL